MTKCLCIKNDGKKCTRNASTKPDTNPNFCWQHQKCEHTSASLEKKKIGEKKQIGEEKKIGEKKQIVKQKQLYGKINIKKKNIEEKQTTENKDTVPISLIELYIQYEMKFDTTGHPVKLDKQWFIDKGYNISKTDSIIWAHENEVKSAFETHYLTLDNKYYNRQGSDQELLNYLVIIYKTMPEIISDEYVTEIYDQIKSDWIGVDSYKFENSELYNSTNYLSYEATLTYKAILKDILQKLHSFKFKKIIPKVKKTIPKVKLMKSLNKIKILPQSSENKHIREFKHFNSDAYKAIIDFVNSDDFKQFNMGNKFYNWTAAKKEIIDKLLIGYGQMRKDVEIIRIFNSNVDEAYKSYQFVYNLMDNIQDAWFGISIKKHEDSYFFPGSGMSYYIEKTLYHFLILMNNLYYIKFQKKRE